MSRALLALLVPSGFKVVPALIFELVWSAVAGWFGGLETITLSLIGVQIVAAISSIATHGFSSDVSRKAAMQGIHMWLVLGGLRAVSHAKLLPLDPYPFSASLFIAIEMLLILNNASDSGLNTPLLTKMFSYLKTKNEAEPVRIDDRLQVARNEYEARNDQPPTVIVEIKDTPKT